MRVSETSDIERLLDLGRGRQPVGRGIEGHIGVSGTAFLISWTVLRWLVTIVLISLLFVGSAKASAKQHAPVAAAAE